MSKVVYKDPKTMYEIPGWDDQRIEKLTVHAESDKSLWIERRGWPTESNRIPGIIMRKQGKIFENLSAAQEHITVVLLNKIKRVEKDLASTKNCLANWRSLLASNPDAGLK